MAYTATQPALATLAARAYATLAAWTDADNATVDTAPAEYVARTVIEYEKGFAPRNATQANKRRATLPRN